MFELILLVYCSLNMIPIENFYKSDILETFLPGIIFFICMYLLLTNIYKMPDLVGTTINVIWTLYSRYQLGKGICFVSSVGHIWKVLICWGFCLGLSHLRFRSIYGKYYLQWLYSMYRHAVNRHFHFNSSKESTNNSKRSYNSSKGSTNSNKGSHNSSEGSYNSNKESYNSSKDTGSEGSYSKNESYHRKQQGTDSYEVAKTLFKTCKTDEEWKDTYRKLMKLYHPDQGTGNIELCQAIQEVYDNREKYQRE